jgi:tetratricopeptide (TPR) repeat protein
MGLQLKRIGGLNLHVYLGAILMALCALAQGAESEDALAAFRAGDYKKAIPLLQAAASKDSKDVAVRAALLSTLVYENQQAEAAAVESAGEADFPNAPEMLTARAEYAFYMGDVGHAEKLVKQSLAAKDTGRATYDLAQMCIAASKFRTARLLTLRAHQLDPDDALITGAFVRYLPAEKRKAMFEAMRAEHPDLFSVQLQPYEETETEIEKELGGRKAYEVQGGQQEVTVPLIYLRNGPQADQVRGAGIELAIEGGRKVRMLLDTGASGILLRQGAVDKAGLKHLGSFEAHGVGDEGGKKSFASVADDCAIGNLRFSNCVFRALEGKGPLGGDEDGLIGTDFFSKYLVEIDFQKRTLHLKPLPERPSHQEYDREVPPGEEQFTPVFRFGHHLLIPTQVNEKQTGLFLLDTGSGLTSIDETFGRQALKMHGDAYMRVRGISGTVKNVYETGGATLQFGSFRQHYTGVTAFNLNTQAGHIPYRMAGILGLPVLQYFRLSIDYRNALVNFDYIDKPVKKSR